MDFGVFYSRISPPVCMIRALLKRTRRSDWLLLLSAVVLGVWVWVRFPGHSPDLSLVGKPSFAVDSAGVAFWRGLGEAPPGKSIQFSGARHIDHVRLVQDSVGGRSANALFQDPEALPPVFGWQVDWAAINESGALQFNGFVRFSAEGEVFAFRRRAYAQQRTTGDSTLARWVQQPSLDGELLNEAFRLALRGTALERYTLEADSSKLSVTGGLSVLSIYGRATGSEGISLAFRADVESQGALVGLEPISDPSLRSSASLLSNLLFTVGLLTLFLLVLTLFIRRSRQRLLDFRGVFVEAAVLGALGAVWGLSMSQGYLRYGGTEGLTWLHLFVVLFNTLIIGLGTGFAGLLLSAVTHSYGTQYSPVRYQGFTLVREGQLFDPRVGVAVIRGMGIGLWMLGLGVIGMDLLPFSLAAAGERIPWYDVGAFAGPLTFALSVLLGFQVTLGGIALPDALLRKYNVPSFARVGIIFVTVACVGFFPISTEPHEMGRLLLLIVMAPAIYAYFRYDVLTAITGATIFFGGYSAIELWLMGGSFQVQSVLILAAAAAIGGMGWVAWLRGSARLSERDLRPSYVIQLEHEARLRRELEIARTVQQSFLPKAPPVLEGIEMAAWCESATEVGGDLYDFIPLTDGKLGVLIGDVSGKGIQAAFYMTLLKGGAQVAARIDARPVHVLKHLNTLIRQNAPKGVFVTVIYGVLDVQSRSFVFARGGHLPLLVRRHSGAIERFQPSGLALGFADSERLLSTLEEASIDFGFGDVVVLLTDGLTEAMNPERVPYGEERLCATLARAVGSAGEIAATLRADVQAFTGAGALQDDHTLVVVQVSA